MTEDEKKAQMIQRNADISVFYQAGNNAAKCASHFRLSRQSIIKILQKSGVWKPYPRGERNKFLGVTVSEETKSGLEEMAKAQGVSVSRLVSDNLDEVVK